MRHASRRGAGVGPCRVRAVSHGARRTFGLTIIELLVAISVIGIIVALLVPAVQAARESARRIQCRNNLKQIGLALHNYSEAHATYPISWGETRWTSDSRNASWPALLLPFIDEANLYADISFGAPLDPTNAEVAATPVRAFLCPSDTTPAIRDDRMLAQRTPVGIPVAAINYRGVGGSNWSAGEFTRSDATGRNAGQVDCFRFGNGIFTGGYLESAFFGPSLPTRPADIVDGMSNTLAVGESVADWCSHSWWYWFSWPNGTMAIPLNYCATHDGCYDDWPNNFGFHSRHVGGGQFLRADGSVIFISQSVDMKTYRAAGTISSGDIGGSLE